jgi:hypothetical protein
MAAVTDSVLQCGVCQQECFLLDDYYKHQCADNNNNVSGKCFYFTKKWNIYKYLTCFTSFFQKTKSWFVALENGMFQKNMELKIWLSTNSRWPVFYSNPFL